MGRGPESSATLASIAGPGRLSPQRSTALDPKSGGRQGKSRHSVRRGFGDLKACPSSRYIPETLCNLMANRCIAIGDAQILPKRLSYTVPSMYRRQEAAAILSPQSRVYALSTRPLMSSESDRLNAVVSHQIGHSRSESSGHPGPGQIAVGCSSYPRQRLGPLYR